MHVTVCNNKTRQWTHTVFVSGERPDNTLTIVGVPCFSAVALVIIVIVLVFCRYKVKQKRYEKFHEFAESFDGLCVV